MADRYWVGGAGNWSDDTNHWATSSGGSPSSGNLPTSSDDVYFDNNSHDDGNVTVTIDISTAVCLNFDSSSLTEYTVRFSGNSGAFSCYGNFDGSRLSYCGSSSSPSLNFKATTTGKTVKFGGNYYASIYFLGVGGGWTLGSNVYTANSFYIRAGTFDANGYNVSGGGIRVDASLGDVVVYMGEGIWKCGVVIYGSLRFRNDYGYSITVYPETALVDVNATTSIEMYTTVVKFYEMTLGGTIEIEGGLSVGALTMEAGRTIKIEAGTTITADTFTFDGESGSLVTIESLTPGSEFYLSQPSGNILAEYLSFTDSNVGGGATWKYDELTSINVSGNTGWLVFAQKVIDETISIVENYSRIADYHKIYTDTINNVATGLKSTSRSISDTITNSDTIAAIFLTVKTISDTISNIDSVARGTIKNVLDSFTTNPPPTPSETLIDSYSETNADVFLDTNTYVLGNTFTGSGLTLGKIKLWLNTATPSVDGTLVVKIYSVTGTYGTGDCVPDTLLATSDEFNVADMLYKDGEPYLQDFTFSGANIITLGDGTHYAFALETITATDNAVNLGMDFSSPTFDGNLIVFMGAWMAFDIYDTCFYAYSSGGGGETINYIIKSITRNILETITITGEVVRSMIFYRTIADVISTTDNIIKGAIKNVSETITNSEEFLRSFIKNLTETITNTEIFSRLVIYYKTISDTISNSDVVLKSITKNISETITISYTLVKSLAREISDTITNSDIIEKTRIRFKEFIETITFSDSIMYIKKIAEYLFGKITGIMTIGKIKSEDVKSKIDSVNITGKIDKQETNSKIEDINFKGKIK